MMMKEKEEQKQTKKKNNFSVVDSQQQLSSGKVTITNRQHDNVNKEVIATHSNKKETVTRQTLTDRRDNKLMLDFVYFQ